MLFHIFNKIDLPYITLNFYYIIIYRTRAINSYLTPISYLTTLLRGKLSHMFVARATFCITTYTFCLYQTARRSITSSKATNSAYLLGKLTHTYNANIPNRSQIVAHFIAENYLAIFEFCDDTAFDGPTDESPLLRSEQK